MDERISFIEKIVKLDEYPIELNMKILDERLKQWNSYHVWTPTVGKMLKLKDWSNSVLKNIQKILARLPQVKIKIQNVSDMKDTFMSLDLREFTPHWREEEETFHLVKRDAETFDFKARPKREKKKNQLYTSKNIETPLAPKSQKTQKILLEESNPQNEQYCICRKGDMCALMIQCEYCYEWYHIDCLALNKSSICKIKTFRCPVCSLLTTDKLQDCIGTHESLRGELKEFTDICSESETLQNYIKIEEIDEILEMHLNYQNFLQEATALEEKIDMFIYEMSLVQH
jgi:hypothetical protein